MPSLEQLDRAVREFIAENPTDDVTVVVDASFGHRIDPSEVPAFEAAEEAGEVVSPPAGAIGRGDAFLLRIAEKTGATVLSNDSFQEFHGEHTWLFDKGRLIGGKPVPGVGWIFMDRTPVRGAKSREVTKEAKRRKRAESVETVAAKGGDKPAGDKVVKPRAKAVDRAIARATQEVVEPKSGAKSRRRRGGAPPAEPLNEPLAFITFIAAHPLGSEVVGSVVEYSSHGAFIDADGTRCYIPLSAMADPAPRKAREVVTKGDSQTFVVQAFDPQRRGVELALPGFAHVAGGPTPETLEAEIRREARSGDEAKPARRRSKKTTGAPDEEVVAGVEAGTAAGEPTPAPARRRARKAVEAGPEPVQEAATGEEAPVAPARKVAARRNPARKSPAAREPATAGTGADERAPAAPRRAPRKAAAAPTGVGGAVTPSEAPQPARRATRAPSVAKTPAAAKTAATKEAAASKAAASKTAAASKAAASKTAAASKATTTKAAATKTAASKAAASKATTTKAAASKAAASKAAATKATTTKAAASKAAASKTAAASKAAATKTATKAAATKAAATKAAATKATATKTATKATATKATATKAAATKAATTRATATKTATTKAAATKVAAKKTGTAARKATAPPAAAEGGERPAPAKRASRKAAGPTS